jgi:hypothetical protein
MELDTLSKLRSKIDAIDDKIIKLLKERMDIVKQVGEFKKETSASQSFIRAGREASMLRDLTRKAGDVFPPQAIATIWRMIISTSLCVEQEISVYTCDDKDNSCYWHAREYFGNFLQIYPKLQAGEVIAAVAKNPSAVGVLPLLDNSQNPWWVRPKIEENNIYVFARIPFIWEDSPLFTPALAIANTSPEPTQDDASLFSITTTAGEKNLQEIFQRNRLESQIISRSGKNNFLVEVNCFVPIGNKIGKEIEHLLGQGSVVRLMGSYAMPIKT